MESSINTYGEETRNQTLHSTSSTISSDGYRLFGLQGSLHQFLGGGKGKKFETKKETYLLFDFPFFALSSLVLFFDEISLVSLVNK